MSSPSKRLKRDPLNSTPNKESKRPSFDLVNLMTSLSSISNDSENKENVPVPTRNYRRRLSFVPEDYEVPGTSSSKTSSPKSENGSARSESTMSNQTEISGDDDYIGEDYDEYFKTLGAIHFKGRVWQLYKPIKEDTLYSKILEEPDSAHVVVTEWMFVYKSDPDNAIISLIQLCVDLAGFTKFNVYHRYETSNFIDSSKSIVEELATEEVIEEHPIIMDGKYLFAERNVTLVKTLRMGVYNFIQKLIKLAHIEGVLYDEKFMAQFLEFIKQMQKSQVRSVRHTGVVIGIKVLTSIILMYNEIIHNSAFLMDVTNCSKGSEAIKLAEQKTSLEGFMESLYVIFMKNCRLPDDKMHQMRMECICESKIWIKYFPKMFISDFQTVNIIMKLILDQSKDVRLASLCALEDLFKISHVVQYLKPVMKRLLKSIEERFLDINVDVVKKAVDIFIHLVSLDWDIITSEQYSLLGQMIFEKNAVCGKAACQYFTKFFHTTTKSSALMLQFIHEIYIQQMLRATGDCTKELLVEGFLHVCESMRDWKTFCKMIVSDKFDEEKRTRLAELFSESVYQYITGKSDVMREMSKEITNVDPDVHKNIADLFPILSAILSEQSNPKILTEILRIIPLVNNLFLDKNYCKEYTDIANAARVIFNYHTDEKLLKNAVQVIVHLCSVVDFAQRAGQISKTVCNENVMDLEDFLRNPVANKYLTVRRVAVLYEHFNLNDQLSFEQLSYHIKEGVGVDDKSASALLDCLRWHLIWELKTLIDTVVEGEHQKVQFDKNALSLHQACGVFFMIAFTLLQNERKSQKFLLEVYIILCDFASSFDKLLDKTIELKRELNTCKLKIMNKKLLAVLLKFLEDNVISNRDMSLLDRRTNVVRYVDLIQIELIPIENITNIFKYYHVYYEDYSPIIDQCLTMYADTSTDTSTICYVVVLTILNEYKKILKTRSVIDLTTEEVSQLKFLVKRFAAFKHFSKTTRNLYTLFYIWMNCAFSDELKLDFLYFLKPFLSLIIDNETNKSIYDNFKKLLPKKFEKRNAVLWLGTALKNLQVKKVQPTPTKKPKIIKEKVSPKRKRAKKDQKKDQKKDPKKGKKKENKPPTKSKSKSAPKTSRTESSTNKKRIAGTESESYSEDDMTIHDSESDDMAESVSTPKIPSNSSA